MDSKTLNSLRRALVDLEAERRLVDEAISKLQGIVRGGVRPVGAPSVKMTKAGAARRKPRWSPAMRKAAAERMRKYWESRRKGAKG